MLPVPANAGAAAAPPISPQPVIDAGFDRSCDGFFLKDGRKIQIGDCALFQSGNSPAFIGIIRSLSSFTEDRPKFIVNWLYRPADIKLAKGILVEAAPNEVFYSFHKDEISAESILHPCKVAFLHRGVELPPRISSFVCRRVYDITNKCLWWLTDQDYIRERQEEVNQLLDKTQIEMHAAVHSGGHSPKPMNGSAPMQQLKSGSDSVQNGGPAGTTHMKSKRRDKNEQNSESIKREQLSKSDDGDSSTFALDSLLKDELAKISDKWGLVDSTGVDKLIGLMQLEKEDRKLDLPGRLLLADVIAATAADRFDCLARFVQLKGLLVFYDWLQEAHKGRVGENGSPKHSDKALEELVLVLLRALEKLPVNLHALQASNIGKSVNNFRSHKNSEIQKKARSLVDTWKKRVDAEITKNDTKFVASSQAVSWSGKAGLPETTQQGGGTRRMIDAVLKNTNQFSTFKNLPVKPIHGDAVMKAISAPPGSSKSPMPTTCPSAICTKDALSKMSVTTCSTDLQFTAVKEEKSTGSSQSLNNNLPASMCHAKTASTSQKDDLKNSVSGSHSSVKTSGGLGRHRKSSNGLSGSDISSFNKSGADNQSPASKVPQPGASSEQVHDHPSTEHGSGPRLIVRLPNPAKSSGQSTSAGSCEEASVVGSRVSSPNASLKQDQSDLIVRIKEDASLAINNIAENIADLSSSCNCAVASGDGAQVPSVLHSDNGIVGGVLNDACTLSTSEKGFSSSVFDSSFCSMDALVESCAKLPEADPSLSAGDDLGMNLLASVATEEMLKSELVHSELYHQRSPGADGLSSTNDDKLKMPHNTIIQDSDICVTVCMVSERSTSVGILKESPKPGVMFDVENNLSTSQEFKIYGENKACAELDDRPNIGTALNGELVSILQEGTEVGDNDNMRSRHNDGIAEDEKQKERIPLEENKSSFNSCGSDFVCDPSDAQHTAFNAVLKEETVDNDQIHSISIDAEKIGTQTENPVVTATVGKKTQLARDGDTMLNKHVEVPFSPDIRNSEIVDDFTSKKAECANIQHNSEPSEIDKKAGTTPLTLQHDESIQSHFSGTSNDDGVRKKGAPGLIGNGELTGSPSKESAQCTELVPSTNFTEVNGSVTGDERMCKGASVFTSDGAVGVSKFDFDLNEGIDADEVSQMEVATVLSPLSCPPAICRPGLTSRVISTITSRGSITIPVAAPAKGPFMPPENLSRGKGEPGWKGSAATSAFRRAEPRKLLEMLISTSDTSSGGKQSRPSFDIDLNVADSRTVDDMVSHRLVQKNSTDSCSVPVYEELVHNNGLDLDLNRADEGMENVQSIGSTDRKWESSHSAARISSGVFYSRETPGLRDFDLNNGPGAEVILESTMQKQPPKSSVLQFLPPDSSYRMSSAELGNMPSWFPSRTAFPAVSMPPFLSDKVDNGYPMVASTGSLRFLGSAASGPVGSFGGDYYRGPGLPSSPAMAFTTATPFTQPNYQFPYGFPLNSVSFPVVSTSYADSTSRVACLPTIVPPLVGATNATSSPYIRPYAISLSDSSASGGGSEGGRRWGGQNLDLNAGPGGLDVETRAEGLPSSSHQLSMTSQTMFPDETGRIYQVTGNGFKRKEPEGGWDVERFAYKQLPWQ